MKYEFKMQPWDHQRNALLVSWNKYYFALLMEYGTGKTKVIIDTTGILYERDEVEALFVIAPNGVHEQWINEQVPEHLPERIPYIARIWTGSRSKKFKRSLEEFWDEKNKGKLKIFTMNVEALQSSKNARNFAIKFLKDFDTLLTVDESTRIKTPGAKRTKFIVNRLGIIAKYRRTLTGNEITRSPFDVYSPYTFLYKDFWNPIPNHHIFTHRFGEWKTQKFPKKSVKVSSFTCPHCLDTPEQILLKRQSGIIFPTCNICDKIVRENNRYPLCSNIALKAKTPVYPKNLKKLINNDGVFEFPKLIKYKNMEQLRAMTKEHSFLVRKEDCMDLPPKIYQPIYCEMNDEQTRIYKELKEELYTEYNGVELSVPNKIALMVRFQQIVGGFFPETGDPIGKKNPKIESMLYDLEDIDCANPIIIWSRFTAEIKAITHRLKQEYHDRSVVSFFGETPKEKRPQIKEDFKAGKIRYFVANQAVGGTGLNLQLAYMMYYYSNSFNAEDRWQSEDRIHRGGQTKTCLYKDIFMRGTVDDTLKKANDDKKNIAEYFKGNEIQDLV